MFAIVGADYGTSALIGAFQIVTGPRIARAAGAHTAVRTLVATPRANVR
ncbi:MAG: hypothetical protein ACRDPC_09565 [Solirubrobacteraceae bacterium]